MNNKIPIENNEIQKSISHATGIKLRADELPQEIGKDIQITLESNPLLTKYCDVAREGHSILTGTITIYTTPADKDFYLTSIYFSLVKDVLCDVATGRAVVTTMIEGATRELIGFGIITLTAQNNSLAISFPYPLKIDRNSAIIQGSTTTAGTIVRSIGITGFTFDPMRYNTPAN
jgi:hypothetical protein